MTSLRSPCIGVFDSGVGGLTVAAALREALPGVDLRYIADSGHAPYGERSADFVRERTLRVADSLCEAGAELIVIACNTATALAADALRAARPGLAVVGIEPGVKPAVQATRNGRVGVLATSGTVRSPRFQQLVAAHGGAVQVLAQACPGVVAQIESGDLDSAELTQLVARCCAPLREAGVDTALLGCTHYPLILPLWQRALPGVQLLRIEAAVARQAQRLWPHRSQGEGRISLSSTGDPGVLLRLAREHLGWAQAELQPCRA